jgi:hypothetical protein
VNPRDPSFQMRGETPGVVHQRPKGERPHLVQEVLDSEHATDAVVREFARPLSSWAREALGIGEATP